MRDESDENKFVSNFLFFLKKIKICKKSNISQQNKKFKIRNNKNNISTNFIIFYYILFLIFINIKYYIL